MVVHESVLFLEGRKGELDNTKTPKIVISGFINSNVFHEIKMEEKLERTNTIAKD